MDAVRVWNIAKVNFADFLSSAEWAVWGYAPLGLVANYIFDDGGVTAQDFAQDQQDWKRGWRFASAELDTAQMTVFTPASPVISGGGADSDNDGLPDWWEILYGLDPYSAIGDDGADGDPDGDGLTNYFEFLTWNTKWPLDPTNPETYSPLHDGAVDSDGDGVSNAQESQVGSNPGKTDTDDDGMSDYVEIVKNLSGANDPLSPLTWRALYGDGTPGAMLTIPETDRSFGVNVDHASLSQDWTVEAWFMLMDRTRNTGSLLRRTIGDSSNGKKFYFDMGLQDGKPYVRASMSLWTQGEEGDEEGAVANTRTTLVEVLAENGAAAREFVWNHYAASWNSTTRALTLYVNGIFAGSTYSVGAPLIDGQKSVINDWQTQILGNYAAETPANSGIYVDNADNYLKGFIDEVRIWTDSSDGRVGLRLEKQIMNFMNRALPVVGLQVEDERNHAMAYYRFDDGGTNAQDFSYAYADEVAADWPHSLKDEDNDLSDRMLAGWDTDGAEDISEIPVLTAVNMEGGGYSEYDPLPDGWQQLYWGPTAGGWFDFNHEWIYGVADDYGRRRGEIDEPEIFSNENNYLMDPITGEIDYDSGLHGGVRDCYVLWTDFFLDDTDVDSAILRYSLGGTVGGTNPVNEIYIFVNAERLPFMTNTPNTSLDPLTGQLIDVTRDLVRVANLYGHHERTTSAPISGELDLRARGLLKKGRNRIAILANHFDNTSTPPSALYFAATVRINGEMPQNSGRHVRWFYTQQDAYSSASYPSILWVEPSQETASMQHAYEKDGVTPLRYFWFERFFAVHPWAYDQDPDGDGLINWTEFLAGTNPLNPDDNGDGLLDSVSDGDSDQLNNLLEQAIGTLPNCKDTDDDGYGDYEEQDAGKNPLDSRDSLDPIGKVLNADGKFVLNVPEVGDDITHKELTAWTLEAWVKPKKAIKEENGVATRQVIIRRTVGRLSDGDLVNYEMGLTDEGLPYAGFTVAKEDATKPEGFRVDQIYAAMTTDEEYIPWDDDTWYHLAATYEVDASSTGVIRIYINGIEAFKRENVADIPHTSLNGLGGVTICGPFPQDNEGVQDPVTKKVSPISQAFVGRLDDVAVWNCARTAAEIQAVYANGLSGTIAMATDLAKKVTFYTWQVVQPFRVACDELVHAFLFDDGGTSLENYAWQEDWYNGWSHAAPLPLYRTMISDPARITDILVHDTDRSDNDADSDGDGMPDWWELSHFGNLDRNGLDDFDGDGLIDYYEYLAGTNPKLTKTVTSGTKNDAELDMDGDGLSNLQEQEIGTHPNNPDTDDDGLSDLAEYNANLDPLNPFDPARNRALDLVQSAHRAYTLVGVQHPVVVDDSETLIEQRTAPFALLKDFEGIDNPRRYTLELWFYLVEGTADGLLLSKTNSTSSGDPGDFSLYLENGKLKLDYNVIGGVGGKTATRRSEGLNDAITFAPGDGWVYVGVVVNQDASPYSSSYQLTSVICKGSEEFVNVRNLTGGIFTRQMAGDLQIGGAMELGGAPKALSMLVDNVRVWTDARTVRQILAARGLLDVGDDVTNLNVYFRFDDGGETAENAVYYILKQNIEAYYIDYVNATAAYNAAVAALQAAGQNPSAELQAAVETTRRQRDAAFNRYNAAQAQLAEAKNTAQMSGQSVAADSVALRNELVNAPGATAVYIEGVEDALAQVVNGVVPSDEITALKAARFDVYDLDHNGV
ncbi:MAG TPA: hypothetical protein PKY10_03220, partial [Lentisphaeria bacterium]|nr:hypothetical protein [Lentisphaeria bacterium]